jgi:hypothetical protein
MDKEHQQQLQDVADSAYARQIWYETWKIGFHKLNELKGARDMADVVAQTFITKCESGFFDVKRQDLSQ